jgi:heme A synthase
MVYVPPPPSRRARELGDRVLGVIEEYRREHPNLTWLEIHQALRLASRRSGSERRRMVLALALGVFLMFGFLIAFMKQDAEGSGRIPAVAIAIVVAVVGLALVVIRLKR